MLVFEGLVPDGNGPDEFDFVYSDWDEFKQEWVDIAYHSLNIPIMAGVSDGYSWVLIYKPRKEILEKIKIEKLPGDGDSSQIGHLYLTASICAAAESFDHIFGPYGSCTDNWDGETPVCILAEHDNFDDNINQFFRETPEEEDRCNFKLRVCGITQSGELVNISKEQFESRERKTLEPTSLGDIDNSWLRQNQLFISTLTEIQAEQRYDSLNDGVVSSNMDIVRIVRLYWDFDKRTIEGLFVVYVATEENRLPYISEGVAKLTLETFNDFSPTSYETRLLKHLSKRVFDTFKGGD